MTTDKRDFETLIDRVYDVAVAPERLELLVDSWSARLNGRRNVEPLQSLAEPQMLNHVARAERVLRELIAFAGEERNSARDWASQARSAAAVVNRAGVVVASNAAARETLGLQPGNSLRVMPLVAEDLDVLTGIVENVDDTPHREGHLLRLRRRGESTPVMVSIVEAVGGDPDQVGLLTSILAWPPRLSMRLQATFGLTGSEVEILKDIALGSSVKEIAESTQRSEPTIRTHVRAVLDKTGTSSQIELVRLTLGLLDALGETHRIEPFKGPAQVLPEPNVYNTVILDDGRKLDYLSIGDPKGRPFLMLPTDMGFTRLPPPAESHLAKNRMCMIVPVRAGYGQSSPIPPRRNAFEVHVKDMLYLCDRLRIDRFPILAMCDDFHLAVATACAAPKRVSAIVALGPTMPATEARHFQRMPKWTRFVFGNARYAPRALPFVTMAFFQCIRRIGTRRFMQMVTADSKADQEVLADDETLTAMLRGSEIAIGPTFAAHVAWAAGAIANYAVDWTAKLRACPVPMIAYAGPEDPFAPIETTREFAAEVANLTLREVPGRGQFLYPEWPAFLAEVDRHLGP